MFSTHNFHARLHNVYGLWFGALTIAIVFHLAIAELSIVSKSDWDGVAASGPMDKLELPAKRVVICHTAGRECNDEEECAQQVRNIQHFHMTQLRFSDIAYNFLIGNDGKIYAGRGWDYTGAYARGYNAGSVGVTFIGTYETTLPNEAALTAAKTLIEEGVETGKIAQDYKLFGHRQLAVTSSPGNALYSELKRWPNWSAAVGK